MAVRTQVYFDTTDHVRIVGDYVLPEEDIRSAALFLHMMPADRKSYRTFQDGVALCGVASLAIDLRGHGDSTFQEGRDEPLNYTKFTDAEHQASIEDVRGAAAYLRELTRKPFSQFACVGASIGANLAIQFASEVQELPLVIALSPGLDYRGIATVPCIEKMKAENQRVILASSNGDTYSHDTIKELHKVSPSFSTIVVQEGSEHGTNLFLDQEFALKVAKALCTMRI